MIDPAPESNRCCATNVQSWKWEQIYKVSPPDKRCMVRGSVNIGGKMYCKRHARMWLMQVENQMKARSK